MPNYNRIRPVSFRLKNHTLPSGFFILEFPENWKPLLQNLQTEALRRPYIPIANLNKAIRMLVPDMISISPRATQAGRRPWLISAEPVPPDRLYLIIHAWVNTAFPRASDASRRRVLQEMQPDALDWNQNSIDLADWKTGDNGTAEPGNGHAFTVLPEWLAASLSCTDTMLQVGPQPLLFRRAPRSPGSSGAELVSWPPLRFKDHQDHAWPYSVLLTLTVQTVPFQSQPVVHCDVGLRRWASRPTSMPGGETSAYLLSSVPWLEGVRQTNSFQVAPLKWQPVLDVELQGEYSRWQPTWGSGLPALLDELHIRHRFPSPMDLLNNPESALHGTPTAAVVWRNGMKPEHGVGPGFMPPDRRELAEQLAAHFAATLEFTELLPRVSARVTKQSNPFAGKRDDGALHPLRRNAIQATIGRHLTIEVWYQTERICNELVQAICEYLGLPIPETFPYTAYTDQLVVTLRTAPLGTLGSPLSVDKRLPDSTRLRRAIEQRITEIAGCLPQVTEPTVAFVELADRDGFDKDADPKFADRLGYALAGRLTQFFTPTTDVSLPDRALSALRDLLRQLGIRSPYPHVNGLPVHLNFVGVWLIKRYAKRSPTRTGQFLPVLVHIDARTSEIRATAPGLGESWLPYRLALLAIAEGEANGLDRRAIAPFLRQVIRTDVIPQGDTLLLCHAHNLRDDWAWLRNTRITQDRLGFDDGRPQPIGQWPGLRVIRVRENQSSETPEWYAQSGTQESFASGLWQIGERVFASTYYKPKQLKNLSTSLSKLSTWTAKGGKRRGEPRSPRPDVHAWNPALIELTVACLQPGDDPHLWATMVHHLRKAAVHYDEATSLPWPLHLAAQIQEYALPLKQDPDEGEVLESAE